MRRKFEVVDGVMLEYRKQCNCDAISRTHSFNIGGGKYSPDRSCIVVTVSYTPGPRCDKCGRAWKRVIPKLEKRKP